MAHKRFFSTQKAREMFLKIERTKRENRVAALEEARHRATDPFELAKLALRRARFVVYDHSLHEPGSALVVVGRRLMTRAEVIAYADRLPNA